MSNGVFRVLHAFALQLYEVPQRVHDDGSPNKSYDTQLDRWHGRMAGAVLMLGGAVMALVAFALFSVGVLGSNGFARAADMDEVRGDLLIQRIEKVERALCMERFDPQLLELRRLLQDEYRMVKGEEYRAPECGILMKIQ